MKSSLVMVVLVLQLAAIALLGGLFLRQNDEPEVDPGIASLRTEVAASLSQQRQLSIMLDQLRGDLRKVLEEGIPTVAPATYGPTFPETASTDDTATATADEEPTRTDVEFPDAHAAMRRVQELLGQRREAMDRDTQLVSPFDIRIQEARDELLKYGTDSLYWLSVETTRQPYDAKRDADLVRWLLEELLVPLSGADRDAAFGVARDALLTSTNDNGIRLLGAEALRRIDSDQWHVEVADLIRLGGSRQDDIKLRTALMQFFIEDPWDEIVPICRGLIGDARIDLALRSKAVRVLQVQDSATVEPTLRQVLFEDHAPEMRIHALNALHARLKESETLTKLLREVIDEDGTHMQDIVRQKAKLLLETIEGQPERP